MTDIKNICIVGGGTAGWFTALYIKKLLPTYNITLLESEEIGIIGAGEGSTVSLIPFLQDIDISPLELISEIKSTLKLGIKFENWNGDGKYYYHPFGPYLGRQDIDLKKFNYKLDKTRSIDYNDEGRFYLAQAVCENLDFNKIILNNILCEQQKANFIGSQPQSLNSFHFDARLLSIFLRQKAEQRNITRIEGKVQKIIKNNEGYITSLLTQDGKELPVDFVFDCSGFSRLILKKEYNTPWKSYQEHLKVNSAIPFILPVKDIFPYTKSTALKHGWLWQIPLQHRIGAGYIFDNNFINASEAQKEVEDFLGVKIEPIKEIKFEAGRLEKAWVKNCIAVGLSYGFTEPIEATSIMLTTCHLSLLNSFISGLIFNNQQAIDKYNEVVSNINDHVMEFLSFHYVTKRKDSNFWKMLANEDFLPQNVKNNIELWKYQIPTSLDSKSYWDQFLADNYLMVGHGLGVFDNNQWRSVLKQLNVVSNKEYWIEISNNLKAASSKMIDHSSFIKNITNG